jgi:methylenetetrahydrofolate dehydrogenase (NADP+)/methenyltetrahydrofolate cyclohydrolase
MPQILDGKKVAAEIISEIQSDIETRIRIGSQPFGHVFMPSKPPCLAVVLCSDDPASQVYVRKKQEACVECGITSYLIKPFEGGIEKWGQPKEHLMATVDYLNNDPSVHGILVQLPLPEQLDAREVFDRINPLKDVDVFSPTNVGLLLQGRPRFVPCTPQGIQELLTRSGIQIAGQKVAIINRSDIVGKPLSALLVQDHGHANATVFMCHDQTPPDRLKEVCLASDIIVVAVGIPGFLTPDMVPEGVVVVDVGINRCPDTKKLVGDVNPAVYPKTRAYSPVPGGVGPLTVASLMKNVLQAQKLLNSTQNLPYN